MLLVHVSRFIQLSPVHLIATKLMPNVSMPFERQYQLNSLIDVTFETSNVIAVGRVLNFIPTFNSRCLAGGEIGDVHV